MASPQPPGRGDLVGNDRGSVVITGKGWARFFCRVILGTIFFMAGWYKCFVMTPLGHAENYFTGPYADTWIPHILLLLTGVTIPIRHLPIHRPGNPTPRGGQGGRAMIPVVASAPPPARRSRA